MNNKKQNDVRKTTSVCLTVEMRAAVETVASDNGWSLSQAITKLIEKGLKYEDVS